MSLYHSAKKNLNEDGQHKNYIILKTIFQKSEETKNLFKEVEAFIKYKPSNEKTTDLSGTNRVNLKRKLNEND